jgi:hypothetical protein
VCNGTMLDSNGRRRTSARRRSAPLPIGPQSVQQGNRTPSCS